MVSSEDAGPLDSRKWPVKDALLMGQWRALDGFYMLECFHVASEDSIHYYTWRGGGCKTCRSVATESSCRMC